MQAKILNIKAGDMHLSFLYVSAEKLRRLFLRLNILFCVLEQKQCLCGDMCRPNYIINVHHENVFNIRQILSRGAAVRYTATFSDTGPEISELGAAVN